MVNAGMPAPKGNKGKAEKAYAEWKKYANGASEEARPNTRHRVKGRKAPAQPEGAGAVGPKRARAASADKRAPAQKKREEGRPYPDRASPKSAGRGGPRSVGSDPVQPAQFIFF